MVGRAVNADVRRFPLRIRTTTVDPVRYTKLAILVHTGPPPATEQRRRTARRDHVRRAARRRVPRRDRAAAHRRAPVRATGGLGG
jgi:hypothetical protein